MLDIIIAIKPLYYYIPMFIIDGVWLSLAERCVRDAEAAGSNPVTPIVQGLRGSPDKAGHKILGRGIFSMSGCYFTPGMLLFCIKIK